MMVVVLVAAIAVLAAPSRSANAASRIYDAQTITRADVEEINAADARHPLLSHASAWSVSPREEARGAGTTPDRSVVATEARGGVYTLRDPETGAVVRTGRSSNLAARESAHANDPVLGDFEFRTEYRTDIYAEQRGLENELYNRYPEAMSENGGFNKIRAVSPTNPKLPDYVQAAADYLARIGPR